MPETRNTRSAKKETKTAEKRSQSASSSKSSKSNQKNKPTIVDSVAEQKAKAKEWAEKQVRINRQYVIFSF